MNKKSLALTSLVLLAPGAAALATPAETPTQQQQLNVASQRAMHGTWLKVPTMCKDRSFAFDPTVVAPEMADANALALFAALDRQG